MPWRFLYNFLLIPLGWLIFQILALVKPKVRRGIDGRRGLFTTLERDVRKLTPGRRRIWFHSSSLGEFEQAKPIIAELKKRHPDLQIVVSFFSPSGYEHSRNYKHASIITYLPYDTAENARKFIDLVLPDAAVIMRYDVWPNHLWELERRNIPVFLASATLRETALKRFPIVQHFFRQIYNGVDYLLTISRSDRDAFQALGLTKPVIDVIGDTRYDQVWRRSAEAKSHRLLPAGITEGKKIVVVGSSWRDDEEHVLPALKQLHLAHPETLVVLAPHEPTVNNLEDIESALEGSLSAIRFSALNEYTSERVILVDSVGILMSLYQYAHVAYVGGSFRQGIHNVLEPAVYGVPLVFGPRHENSQEAVELVKCGAARVGTTEAGLYEHLQFFFENETERAAAGIKAYEFVRCNIGATEKFLSYLAKVL